MGHICDNLYIMSHIDATTGHFYYLYVHMSHLVFTADFLHGTITREKLMGAGH